jgi:hypothetical protein
VIDAARFNAKVAAKAAAAIQKAMR